ncbi:unnamed protein product [Closterium sp. Naga37s-1]|nr:unnamed protein product [Closterium sp. Naga37s-1]
MRAEAQRQAAEVAYVKGAAVCTEGHINDVKLELAALKAGAADKSRGEREESSAEEHAGAERRKREGSLGKEGEVACAAAGIDSKLTTACSGSEEKGEEEERESEEEWEANGEAVDTEAELQEVWERVEALEETSPKTWEAVMKLWSKVTPGETCMDLSSIHLSDRALTRATSLCSLTWLSLRTSSSFAVEGVP